MRKASTIRVEEDFRIPGTNIIVEKGDEIEVLNESHMGGTGTFTYVVDGTTWHKVSIMGYDAYVAKIDSTHFKWVIDTGGEGVEKALRRGSPAVYHVRQFLGEVGYEDLVAWLRDGETIAGKVIQESNDNELREAKNYEIVKDALALSSGTISNLTGLRKYDSIDRIQTEFVLFIQDNPEVFGSWLEAWEVFSKGRKFSESVNVKTDMRRGSGVRWHRIERDGKTLYLRRVDLEHFAVSEKSDTRLKNGKVYSLDDVKQYIDFHNAVKSWLRGRAPIGGKVFESEVIEEKNNK